MTIDELNKIIEATQPEDVFGSLDDYDDELQGLKQRYHQLIRWCHPDRNQEFEEAATAATQQLGILYEAAKKTVVAGVYGTEQSVPVDTVKIRTSIHTYEIVENMGIGDVCHLYKVKHGEGDSEDDYGVLKVVHTGRDNDLIKNEAVVLRQLHDKTREAFRQAGKTDDDADRLLYYVPKLIETFVYRNDEGRLPQQANVFDFTPNLFDLTQVREKYPDGVDPKDAAWIFRRLLVALNVAHSNGYIHGAVLPEHIMIEPAVRGMVLVDWKYATKAGDSMAAIPARYKTWYPQEVLNQEKVGPGTDIWLAAQSMAYILGAASGDPVELSGSVPRALRAFLIGCMLDPESRRPQNPTDLLREFDSVLERLWGKREFVPMDMS